MKLEIPRPLRNWTARLRGDPVIRDLRELEQAVRDIDGSAPELRCLSDQELAQRARELARTDPAASRAHRTAVFALVREVARRSLGMWAFASQLMAAWSLCDDRVAQLPTGEGKTLAGVFAAAHRALSGSRAHVWTANDYLARRDAAWMGPIYERLGLRAAAASEALGPDAKRDAYRADVTYVSANELGFDFLRDQLQREPSERVLQPFAWALLDEIDSILIDEARNPLVLACAREGAEPSLARMTALVSELVEARDYEVDERTRTAHFTEAGARRLEAKLGLASLYAAECAADLNAAYRVLLARALYRRDVDYVIRDGKVELVDELKGRVAVRRRWPDGLQEAIEAKEGLASSGSGRVLHTITLQHLVLLYPSVSGMTATAESAADELAAMYGLEVVCVPSQLPCVRVDHPDEVYTHAEARDRALCEEIARVHATRRPILVGTSSVEESEQLAEALRSRGISFQLLNARHVDREAALIAEAGALGALTLSTNMAGRGTDIVLGGADGRDRDAVVARGGLYVLGTRRHASVRIDHQLRGRAGRQGDPGSSRFYIHLSDPTIAQHGLHDLIPARYREQRRNDPIASPRVCREIERAQRICEARQSEQRRVLARYADIVELQRRRTFDLRDRVLAGEIPGLLQAGSAERFAALAAELGPDVLGDVERALLSAQIERSWPEHLARVGELREVIPLVSLGLAALPSTLNASAGWLTSGRATPVEFFERHAHDSYCVFEQEWRAGVIDVFERSRITHEGIDLIRAGLPAPSATWTYLLTDHAADVAPPKGVRRLRARLVEWLE